MKPKQKSTLVWLFGDDENWGIWLFKRRVQINSHNCKACIVKGHIHPLSDTEPKHNPKNVLPFQKCSCFFTKTLYSVPLNKQNGQMWSSRTTSNFSVSFDSTILPNSHGYVDLEVRTCSYIHMDRISFLWSQMDYGLVNEQREKRSTFFFRILYSYECKQTLPKQTFTHKTQKWSIRCVCVNTLFLVNSKSIVASAMMFIRSSKARICRGLPGVATSLTFIGW